MLKNIPKILSPELLKVLCEMGHSDRIVIGDGNFPAQSMGKNAIVIRCDGHGVPEILEAILQLFPLDIYVDKPVSLMEVMPGDTVETPIWDEYKKIVAKYDERGAEAIGNISATFRRHYCKIIICFSFPFSFWHAVCPCWKRPAIRSYCRSVHRKRAYAA